MRCGAADWTKEERRWRSRRAPHEGSRRVKSRTAGDEPPGEEPI